MVGCAGARAPRSRDYAAGAAGARRARAAVSRFSRSAKASGCVSPRSSEHGQDDCPAMVEAALGGSRRISTCARQWVWILLEPRPARRRGERGAGARSQDAPGFAVASRLRLEADRGDEIPARLYRAARAQAQNWDVADAIRSPMRIARARAPWAFESAQRHRRGRSRAIRRQCAAERPAHPADDRAPSRTRPALALIDEIPRALRPPRSIWSCAPGPRRKRGRHEDAKTLWRQGIATQLFRRRRLPDRPT